MKRMRRFITIACFILVLVTPLSVKAVENDIFMRQFRILFISSYGFSNAAVPDQLAGFQSGIEGINTDIHYEFMDADKYYGGHALQNFDNYTRYKIFAAKKYDLVVVSDDPALRYAINNRNALFPDTPLVFMGVNNKSEATTAAAMKNTTGITENPDFEGNYALMCELFPERTHMNVVLDSSIAGQGDYVEFMKFREKHPEISSTVINTSYYTPNGLIEVMEELDEDDIILFLDFSIDGEKKGYNLENASEFLSTYAPDIPIIRLASTDIGHGVFGGISYSYYDAGKMAGEAAKKILGGENADNMPLMTSVLSTAYFEQGAMDKFGIKYSQLPEGSIVINEHRNLATFYRENMIISNLVIVIAVLMVIIIVMLYFSNIHRKRMIRTDFLTQMPNRKKLTEDVNSVISSGDAYGIIMMDIDHFKDINDTYGHKVGDEVIVEFAKRLQKLADKKLSFARLGGDEFSGLILSPTTETDKKICERIVKITDKPVDTSQGKLKITVSVGCAAYPIDLHDPHKVMECADMALYETKENGRNGFALFSGVNNS